MDSHQRRKRMGEILRLAKDPEVAQMVREIFCATGNTEAQTQASVDGVTRKDLILSFIAAAVTIATVLVPRNPISVLSGSLFTFVVLLHPAWHFPYVIRAAGLTRIRRRVIALVVLVTIMGSFGYIMFRLTVEERNGDVFRNLTPSLTVIDSHNAYSTVFSVSNDSSTRIISQYMVCHVNEGLGERNFYLSNEDSMISHMPQPIEPGKDARSTQCLKPMAGGATLYCVDLTLELGYTIDAFPRSEVLKQYRFVLRRSDAQYQWARVALSEPNSMCTGHRLWR